MSNPGTSLVFVGPINPAFSSALRNVLCSACNNGVDSFTLYLSSLGGSVLEGFALYHFIRSLPIKIATHNIGAVGSIANIVFLAGQERFAAENSHFFFHDLSWGIDGKQDLVRAQLSEPILLLNNDAENFVALFKRETSLTEEDFERLKLLEKPVIIKPAAAKEMGIVHEVKDPKHASGAEILNLVT